MTTNLNGVHLSYLTHECPDCGQIPWEGCKKCDGTGQALLAVTTRGASEDILSLLRDGVVGTIRAQIKLSHDFNVECARQDESDPQSDAMKVIRDGLKILNMPNGLISK